MCLAIPGRIISMESGDPTMRIGRVDFGGVVREISLAFVPGAVVDDYVIVHAGFAISTVDESEAKLTLDYIEQVDCPGNAENNTE